MWVLDPRAIKDKNGAKPFTEITQFLITHFEPPKFDADNYTLPPNERKRLRASMKKSRQFGGSGSSSSDSSEESVQSDDTSKTVDEWLLLYVSRGKVIYVNIDKPHELYSRFVVEKKEPITEIWQMPTRRILISQNA